MFYLPYMKTIGIVGGTTWLSTIDYYRLLNQAVNERLGGVSSAKIILNSLNFEEIKQLVEKYNWDGIAGILIPAAISVANAGADCMVLAANTMHRVADEVSSAINIPLIHIGEATAAAVAARGITNVALLGTRYTMQLDFYKDKLAVQGISTIIPSAEDIECINASIFNEMGKGIFTPAAKQRYLEIIDKLIQQGAQGVILGCTEIPILIKQEDCSVPTFDTTAIHVQAIINYALQ